jgi:hypothetical protein
LSFTPAQTPVIAISLGRHASTVVTVSIAAGTIPIAV